MFIISWDFLMAEQMFLPPQPKQTVMWLLVINWYMRVASWVAERLKIQNLRGLGNIRKISKFKDLLTSAWSSSQDEDFVSATTMVIIFWEFLFFTKFSFHHKWNEAWLLVINCIYELPHELSNDLIRFRILGN